MATMRIERPGRRRSSLLPFACGCLAALGILGAIVVIGGVLLLPQIIKGMTGLTPAGQTAQVFAGITPQPTAILQNPTEPAQITVDLGQYGQQTIANNQPQLYNFTVGTSSSGQQEAQMTFTEAGLMQLCMQKSTVCGPNSSDPHVRNARIDLQPGGAIVYVDVTVPQFGNQTIPAGIVLKWDQPSKKIMFTGIDLLGTLYTTPPPDLADTINTVQAQLNDLIQQMAVQVGNGSYTIDTVNITDTDATILLH